jgi:catechol 2,3-dioxygenase-like lactoylglutathione lyase family enzyme
MSFAFIGLDHVQVAMPKGEEAKVRQFYGDILGMTEIPKPEELQKRGGVWFRCGAQELHLGVEEPFAPARKAHPAFLIRSFSHLLAQLEQHQVAYTEDFAIPGRRRIFVHDPFGNRLEMIAWEE